MKKLKGKLAALWMMVVSVVMAGMVALPSVSAEFLTNETQDDIIQLAVLAMILSILFGLGAYFRYRR